MIKCWKTIQWGLTLIAATWIAGVAGGLIGEKLGNAIVEEILQ